MLDGLVCAYDMEDLTSTASTHDQVAVVYSQRNTSTPSHKLEGVPISAAQQFS